MPAPLRLAVLLCAVLAACGGEDVADNECQVVAVRYGETRLDPSARRVTRDLPARTGEVLAPGVCTKRKETYETRRGIPPSVAVFPQVPDDRARMYIAHDTLEALAGHPLHRYLYRSAKRPDLTSGGGCKQVRFDAELINKWRPGQLLIDLRGRETVIRVEAATQLNGPVRDGVPRIPEHASLRVEAVRCNGPRALVARRVTVRSP